MTDQETLRYAQRIEQTRPIGQASHLHLVTLGDPDRQQRLLLLPGERKMTTMATQHMQSMMQKQELRNILRDIIRYTVRAHDGADLAS